ncbi:hypothetical protein F443_19692 [Phytophthora nicotianae P1569]|uniref:Uncharacterized protein n=1 Tax=Phytophthora nicotianae P1569 TaxID=1317065 RepID=V9E3J9_PHYNI|nr:hypothetical protein F443_19692 [Phytophthora nicotianae P1569]
MGTRYTLDGDGDVEMSAPQPVYKFIKAPKLASWDLAFLIVWNRECEQYLTKIRHRCSVTGEIFDGVMTTVKGSEVGDAAILAQEQKRCRTLKNAFIPDLATLFRKSLKMDMQVDDCDARVSQYFQPFTKIVEDNGLQALIDGGDAASPGCKDRMKARRAILVENIQHAMLKEQIKRLNKYERRDCRTDDAALFDLILEHAWVQQQFHAQSVERVAPQTRGQPQQQQNKRASKPVKTTAPSEKRARAPPRDGCLVCRGAHWLDKCPTATAGQKAEALPKLREAKLDRNDSVRSKTVSSAVCANMVRMDSELEMPYIPDSGADRTMIPRVVVTSLQELNVDLGVEVLGRPIPVYLADGRHVNCVEEVVVALELVTAA